MIEGYGAGAVEHFTSPRNVGAVDAPDGKGSDANPSCGDRTTMTLRIADGRIAEARFRTFGCTAAIASASVLTELATGRTTADAAALEPRDVLRALGGLPPRKEPCALMAVGALRAALLDAHVRVGEERLGPTRERGGGPEPQLRHDDERRVEQRSATEPQGPREPTQTKSASGPGMK